MSKFGKIVSAVKEILKNPWLLNNVLNDNSVWQRKAGENYKLENGLLTIQLDDLFPNFSEEIASFSFLGGGSLPTDVALLKSVCRKFENTSYFEIGTWRGESVRNVADVAKECFTLNLSRQQIIDLGFSEKYADAHAFFSKNLENVTHLYGDSKEFDFAGLKKQFDVVFIDGNHHYNYVVNDTKNVFKHLLHENSIVIWHDYAFDPETVRFEILNAILEGTPKEFHGNLYHVANTMCAIFIKGDFSIKPLDPAGNPTKTYQLKIQSKDI